MGTDAHARADEEWRCDAAKQRQQDEQEPGSDDVAVHAKCAPDLRCHRIVRRQSPRMR